MEIAGKVFVVTGGGNGIGREVVLGLLTRGARVAAVDLSADGLAETARLAGDPAGLTTHALSVADRDAVAALPEKVLAEHGQVDGLVNVAGIIQRFVKFAELGYDDVARVMDVNFWGVVNTCKEFLPHLMARPAAALVNVSSMGAFAPVPGQAIYGASKAAVKLLTDGLYAELMGTNVTVTTVFPGAIATNISANSGVGMPAGDAAAAESSHKMTPAPEAGRQIIAGIESGAYRVCIGSDSKMLDRFSRLSPKRATEMIAKKMADLLG